MKIRIWRILYGVRGFMYRARKRRVAGEFLSIKPDDDLGRQELEKFIYW